VAPPELPAWLRDILPEGTATAWLAIRDVLPASAYLGGGTAIAVHLRHRMSRDLDFFLLLAIERDGGRTVDEGIALALRKYRPRAPSAFVESLLRGLGYLEDVLEDPAVPLPKREIAAYWERRVPQVTAALSRLA
jgi:Nucleotidyl transferase AbiEii toxin, Type IV TA system